MEQTAHAATGWSPRSSCARARAGGFRRAAGETLTVDWAAVTGFTLAEDGQGAANLLATFEQLRPADLANVLHELSPKRRAEVAAALDDERLADVLEELPEDDQVEILGVLEQERAADVLEAMAPDDAADLLGELPPRTQASSCWVSWSPTRPTTCGGCSPTTSTPPAA